VRGNSRAHRAGAQHHCFLYGNFQLNAFGCELDRDRDARTGYKTSNARSNLSNAAAHSLK
jgi:hypothetical protein